MPKFTEEQLRTWSEYEEGWNADDDASNPYDARTYPGRAWRLGFTERDTPESDAEVATPPEWSDDDLIREVQSRGYSLLPSTMKDDDLLAEVQRRKLMPSPSLSDFTSADLTRELERRGLERPEPKKLEVPKCPFHPLREVTRRGNGWYCAGGHMFETPGQPMPKDEELPRDCPDHPGSLLDLIAQNPDSNLYYCGSGQHHIRLSQDGFQVSLARPGSENFQ